MSGRFDAILFDAGGVLVLPDPVAIGGVLGPLRGATDVPTLVRAHYAGIQAIDVAATRHPGRSLEHHDWDVYRRAYLVAARVPEEATAPALAALRSLFSPFLWRFPLLESVSALWRLHRHGTPIGVVSNANGQIEGVLASQGVCQVGRGGGVPVTVVVDSDVVGVAKPDPAIFAPALAALGDPDPARVAYVGDSLFNDVGAASAAGLRPLLFDPYGFHAAAPCERLESLHRLLD